MPTHQVRWSRLVGALKHFRSEFEAKVTDRPVV
ncbi:NADH dehydrogenase I subunit F, partial [Acinetobacter baumannii ABNIH10]